MPYLVLKGEKLRDIRLRKGLSQDVLANMCGLERRAIGRAEASKQVSLTTARLLYKHLQIRRPEDFVLEVIDEQPAQRKSRGARDKGGNGHGKTSKRRR